MNIGVRIVPKPKPEKNVRMATRNAAREIIAMVIDLDCKPKVLY